jgi:hypothetical protein
MDKDKINYVNVLIIAIVLCSTYYALQEASNIFEELFIICVSILATIFGRNK